MAISTPPDFKGTVIRGSRQPIKVSTKQVFDPNRGTVVTEEWASAGDNLNGLAQQCIANKVNYDLTPNQKMSRISFSTAGEQSGFGQLAVDSWQLICNERDRPIKFCRAVREMFADDEDSIHVVDKAVEDYKDGGKKAVAAFWFTDGSTQARLFRFLVNGGTTFAQGQYVLRHQTNVSNKHETNVADLGVESVYLTTSLVNEITDPGFWLFPCPPRLVAKINRIEVQEPSTGDLTWGWRKLPSQETTAAGNRIDITTEYWLGAWPLLQYPVF